MSTYAKSAKYTKYKKGYKKYKKYKKVNKTSMSSTALSKPQRKEVKKIIHGNIENKCLYTFLNDNDELTTESFKISFQGWKVVNQLPVIPIIQTIQNVNLPSVDEQIQHGVYSDERIGMKIRVMKLKIFYNIAIPVELNVNIGTKIKVKCIIYSNKLCNDPGASQFGASINGYNIFRGGTYGSTANTNLLKPSGTMGDLYAPIDKTRYKVHYSHIHTLTPPCGLLQNNQQGFIGDGVPQGEFMSVDCTKFISKFLKYDANKEGSALTACNNENLYMTFLTCQENGSAVGQEYKFSVFYNHYISYEDA